MVWSPLALAPGLGPRIRLCKTTSHLSSLYFLTYILEPALASLFGLSVSHTGFAQDYFQNIKDYFLIIKDYFQII